MPKNAAETTESKMPIKAGVSAVFSREKLDRRVSVAPMMDWTDRHCRYFLRGFSPDFLLYTEMITAAAILRGNRDRLLAYDAAEHPLALQLGGSDPADLASAARIGAQFGYDEINLNCGCPSDRVHSGAFGACLMLEPVRVAECVAAMRAAVSVPVTVKMRIGVVAGHGAAAREAIAQFTADDARALMGFVAAVSSAGAAAVIVHARKAVRESRGAATSSRHREGRQGSIPAIAGYPERRPAAGRAGAGGAVMVRRRDARSRGLSSTVAAGGVARGAGRRQDGWGA
jgi:tRNA-dihydrouridine synthase